MPDVRVQCPKCGHDMENGFLVDTVFPGTAALAPQGERLVWAKGNRSEIPDPSWFSALTSGIGFLISSAETKPVSTLRCIHCGYLELFAK